MPHLLNQWSIHPACVRPAGQVRCRQQAPVEQLHEHGQRPISRAAVTHDDVMGCPASRTWRERRQNSVFQEVLILAMHIVVSDACVTQRAYGASLTSARTYLIEHLCPCRPSEVNVAEPPIASSMMYTWKRTVHPLPRFLPPTISPDPGERRDMGERLHRVDQCGPKPSYFPGHHQPHIPADLGFYDLRLPETRVAQASLAANNGIDGFVYYHYWFNGRQVLERPFAEVLSTGEPDFPFCLAWANEDWTGNGMAKQRRNPGPTLFTRGRPPPHSFTPTGFFRRPLHTLG